MRINREKCAAFLAGIIFLLGIWGIAAAMTEPAAQVTVPEIKIPESTRKILPKKRRLFTEEVEPGRNPFAFSEGWQRMETTPMTPPGLGATPRPGVLLWPGATASEAGLIWLDHAPAGNPAERKEGTSP